MSIQTTRSHIHWNYFIALEQDLMKLSRFIEFSEENFDVYSIELAHLLLAASSEVDVVLKALCNLIKPSKNHKNINDYKETVLTDISGLITDKCYISRHGLEFQPWSSWAGEENPGWWQSHNNVKHTRNTHFNEANLKNTLDALTALSLVVLYYYQRKFSEGSDIPYDFRDVTKNLQPSTSFILYSEQYIYHQFMV